MTNNNCAIPNTIKNLVFVVFLLFNTFCTAAQSTYSISSEFYSSIHYNGKAMITAGEQYRSCQFYLVNVIDSFLYVHISVAGIEVGRTIVTPDSVLLINKIEKKYYQGDYSFFQHLIGVVLDFYTFQALFNNFPITVPEEVELSYQQEYFTGEYDFFKTILCKYENFEVELEIKKVTFNDVPEVSITIPKNFSQIFLNREEQ